MDNELAYSNNNKGKGVAKGSSRKLRKKVNFYKPLHIPKPTKLTRDDKMLKVLRK